MPAVCESTYPVADLTGPWGAGPQTTLYSVATSFIDVMQGRVHYPKAMHVFYAIMSNGTNSEFNSNIQDDGLAEPGYYLWIALGVILGLIAVIWAVFVYRDTCTNIRRYSPRHPRRRKNGNSCGVFAQFFFYSLAISFILTAFICYCISHTQQDPDYDIDTMHDRYISNIFNVSLTGTRETQCTYEATVAKEFALATESMLTEPAMLVKWFEDYSGISKINLLEAQALQTSLQGLSFWCNNIISELLRLRLTVTDCVACIDEIDYNLNVLYNTSESLSNLVNEMPVTITDLNQTLSTGMLTANTFGQNLAVPFANQLKNINNTATKIHNVLNSVVHVGDVSAFWATKVSWTLGTYAQQGLNDYQYSWLRTFALVLIIIISLFSILSIMTVCVTIWSKTKKTCCKCICDVPININGLLKIVFYCFILAAPVVLVIAMFSYTIAFPMSLLCSYLYEEKGQYTFYEDIEMETYSNRIAYLTYSSGEHTINYGMLIYNLANEDTLYSALETRNLPLINPDDVSKDLGFDNVQPVKDVINNEYLYFYVDAVTAQKFKAYDYNLISSTQTLDDLQMTGFLPNTRNKTAQASSLVKELNAFTVETNNAQYAVEMLNYLIQGLISFNEQDLKTLMLAQVTELFAQQNELTEKAVDDLLNLMQKQVYNSKSVYFGYSNPVSLYCVGTRQPINGLFAASGLLFFGMFFSAILFRCSLGSSVIKNSSMRAYVPSRPAPPPPIIVQPQGENRVTYSTQQPTAPLESPISTVRPPNELPSERPPMLEMNSTTLEGTLSDTTATEKWG